MSELIAPSKAPMRFASDWNDMTKSETNSGIIRKNSCLHKMPAVRMAMPVTAMMIFLICFLINSILLPEQIIEELSAGGAE